jgi:hypothetical protein
MTRQVDNMDVYCQSLGYFQKLEKTLAVKLGLSEMKSGIQIIRDNNGWRQNEKSIKWIWIVTISRSFVGWGGLFSIKFNEHKFREHLNPEETVQGLFTSGEEGISQIYRQPFTDATYDVSPFFKLNLFEANNGIALDGVSYNVKIIAPNVDAFIQLNNPNTEDWKKWETELWTLGRKLAKESNNPEMIQLFE